MGWSAGTFTLTDGTYTTTWSASWAGDGDATIETGDFVALLLDAKNGINACFPADGQKAATGNWDLGTYRLTNITASANTDAGTFGKQVASGAFAGTDITLTLQDTTTITIDVSGLTAGTGGVDLTTAQTVAGIKTFSAITSLAHAKFNGPTTEKVATIASGGTPTCDATAANAHFLSVTQNVTGLAFTWPTGASDSELGNSWKTHGSILCRWAGADYTFALDSTMLSALDDYEIEGTPATGSGEMSTLVYTYYYLNGTEYAQFAWVATP